jgi:TP901 family phage tail tape measure protein
MSVMQHGFLDMGKAAQGYNQILFQLARPAGAPMRNFLEQIGFPSSGIEKLDLGSLERIQKAFASGVARPQDVFANWRAFKGVSELFTISAPDELRDVYEQQKQKVSAEAEAQKRMETYANQMLRLTATVDAFKISLGELLSGPATGLVRWLGTAVEDFNKLPGPIKEVALAIGLILAVGVPTVLILGQIRTAW